MKNFNISILLMLLIGVCSSCKKYLEKKPDTSMVVPKSLSDLQGMMNDFSLMNDMTPALSEASTDDYFVTQELFSSYEEELQLVYTWRLDNYNFQNDWANAYSSVYNANYCLEKIENVGKNNMNAKAWDNVKGAALFYRGAYFLWLAWDFAKAYDETTADSDLGIVLRLGSDFNQKSVRASVRTTYQQILTDLKLAASLLPEQALNHVAQPSKVAAYGMLARAYLSMRQYDSAGLYAGKALAIKSKLLDYNDGTVNQAGNVPFQPMNPEIVFYANQWIPYRSKNPDNGVVDSVLYASYEKDDLRKTVFFRSNGRYWRFKGSYAAHQTRLFTGITTGELYLTKAECDARTGSATEALQRLNTFLMKRWVAGKFVPLTISDQPTLLSKILLERRKELIFRGLRWQDIKRLNKEGRNITPTRLVDGKTYTLLPNSPRYALPIPKDIINQTGIPQN